MGDPCAGFVLTFMAGQSMGQIFGLLWYLQYEFNMYCALALAAAAGLSVEYNAHILIAINLQQGTPWERSHKDLMEKAGPVVLGGVTSIIGCVPIYFHEMPVMVKYFSIFPLV